MNLYVRDADVNNKKNPNQRNYMKPTHKIFCYGCHRPKMLFETQSKADNFIRYNREAILKKSRKAPVRSYYCEICCGWHVTSNPSVEEGEMFNQQVHQMIDDVISSKNNTKADRPVIGHLMQEIRKLVSFAKFDEAQVMIDSCIEQINSYCAVHRSYGTHDVTKIKQRLSDIMEIISLTKDILSLPEDEQLAYRTERVNGGDGLSVGMIVSNVHILKQVDAIVADNENSLRYCNMDDILVEIVRGRRLLDKLKGCGRKKVKSKYNAVFKEQRRQMNLLQNNESSIEDNTAQHDVKEKPYKNEYKTAILSLIERLEIIQKSYGNSDYDACETNMEIAYYILDELNINDENTALIREHLRDWSVRIHSMKKSSCSTS